MEISRAWADDSNDVSHLSISHYNKGCTREFLYIRNSHPRLKLTLIAEKCTAGMHVNTHSCPLRTQKLTIIHGFLPRLTLTSEGGELVNPQKTKIHNETQKICVISLRRSRGRMILNARKCWTWRREGLISEKEVKKYSQTVNFLEKKHLKQLPCFWFCQ